MNIDFINTFNEVQCLMFLKECCDKFPQIFKWENFCCSQHSLLFFGEYTTGVQQGDPLGPFLFCLVLQILVNKIKQEIPTLSLNSWYMDDGSLFGLVIDISELIILFLSQPHTYLYGLSSYCHFGKLLFHVRIHIDCLYHFFLKILL